MIGVIVQFDGYLIAVIIVANFAVFEANEPADRITGRPADPDRRVNISDRCRNGWLRFGGNRIGGERPSPVNGPKTGTNNERDNRASKRNAQKIYYSDPANPANANCRQK